MATNYVTQSMIGVDLNNSSATALFAVGTHVLGTNGTEYVYVHSATSVSALTMVAINTVSYTAGMASGTDLTAGSQFAFAQGAISAQAYGWVALRGVGLTCACTGSATAPTGVGIHIGSESSKTGTLCILGSASGTLAGVQITDATLSTSTGVGYVTLNVTWPRPASTIAG